jgi:hypothetical protein
MGHFLTILTQNPHLYFGRFGQTRVYWSAYVPRYEPGPDSRGGDIYPPQEGSYKPTVKKAFAKAIEKSEVVVFSRETIQCSVVKGGERELTDEESLQEEIYEAETKGSKGGENEANSTNFLWVRGHVREGEEESVGLIECEDMWGV